MFFSRGKIIAALGVLLLFGGVGAFFVIKQAQPSSIKEESTPSLSAPAITFTPPAPKPASPDLSQTQPADAPVAKSDVPASTAMKHVFVVVEENNNYSDIMGNTKDMPYFNSLANTYGYAKQYYADTHPSIGNYFMLTTGKILTNQDSFGGTVGEDNIVRQLLAAHKTWKEYSQTLPSVGYIGADADPYEQHHNPLSYFSDVRNDPGQRQNLVPIEQLKIDIANHTLPDFAFIVPDNSNDGHDCPHGKSCQTSDKLSAVDKWLQNNIEPLIRSSDFNSPNGGLLIITFDEASKSDTNSGGGHVAWVAVGPNVKKGYSSSTHYQHENTLRFMLESLGLSQFPGKAADASRMNEFTTN